MAKKLIESINKEILRMKEIKELMLHEYMELPVEES